MEEIECVRSFFDAFNARDWARLRMSLDARFAFRGAPPLTQFMDSATFIEALQSFVEAVPDFTFQESIEHTQDNAVTVSIRPHGTHTRAFVFPMALRDGSNASPIEANNQQLDLPNESLIFTIGGEGHTIIRSIELTLAPGTEIPTLFPTQSHSSHIRLGGGQS